jgi:membrane protein implicated in regulation of membrane protease activity
MLGLYLASLLFGGILIGASLFLGGKDADTGGHPHAVEKPHFDKEAVTDALKSGGGEKIWFLFLSMRFWTFFTASFGLTGLLLELLVSLSPASIGAIALLNGLSIGLATAWMFKRLKTDQVSGDIGLTRLVGQEARVVVPIRPGDVGKIVVSTLGGSIELLARTSDERAIDSGATVLVAHVQGGIAEVTVLPADTAKPRPTGQTLLS